MEIIPRAVSPRVPTTLFDLCAAVQASVGEEEREAGVEVPVIAHLLMRAWWEGEEEAWQGHAEAA